MIHPDIPPEYINQIVTGDARELAKRLPDESVNCIVTSPPYWGLRDYGIEGQTGQEETPEQYVAQMIDLFRELRRVLRDDGTLWLNLGDSYANNPSTTKIPRNEQGNGTGVFCVPSETQVQARRQSPNRLTPLKREGLKHKDLIGIPWRVAFALQADGWYLRSDIIWAKPNPMPESVTDRPTKAHEYIFLLAKSERYYYDATSIAEPSNGWNGSKFDDPRDLEIRPTTGRGPRNQKRPTAWDFSDHDDGKPKNIAGNMSERGVTRTTEGLNLKTDAEKTHATKNKRTVWTVATQPYAEAHFATYPPKLIEPCILAGCPVDGIVLDPFSGAGTTAMVAKLNKRNFIGFELNPAYVELARERVANSNPPLFVLQPEQLSLLG